MQTENPEGNPEGIPVSSAVMSLNVMRGIDPYGRDEGHVRWAAHGLYIPSPMLTPGEITPVSLQKD